MVAGVAKPVPLSGSTGHPDRYEPRRLLGKGGMGEVLLSKDLTIGREVAIKRILPDHASNPETRNRFIREAQIQGQLEHPAIVPVYDLAVSTDGTVFFTMKRLRGRTLEEILKGLRAGHPEDMASFSRHRLLVAFSAVCLAVEFAHSRGVLHRDLKPANIMLGDFGEVYVLDWGVAKVCGGAAPADTDIQSLEPMQATMAGQIVGTIAYMSPEQAAGQTDAVDARSDIFTLGLILFEILTFERLRQDGSPQDMLQAIRMGESASLSQRQPSGEVPPELESICLRAISREPAERYQTARDLHRVIDNYIAGERDTALRKQLALMHSRAATESMERAILGGEGEESARRKALAEVGRALALEPTDAAALHILRRILTEPPQELPGEVERQAQAELAKEELLRMRGLLTAAVVSLFMISILLLMGVRDWACMSTLFFLACISIALRWYTSRLIGITVWHYGVQLSMLGLAACYGRILGPLWLLAFALTPQCVAAAISAHRSLRVFTVVGASLLLAGMFTLEHIGVLQQSYRFEGGNLVVVANLVALPSTWTQVLLLGLSFLSFWLSFLVIGRLPKFRLQAEHRIALQTWHLRQLLPESEQLTMHSS